MDKIVKEALKRFELCQEAEADTRKLSLEDLKFRAGEQWPQNVSAARDMDGRPCLTINRVPQFIRQVTNDARMNRPSIKVVAVEDSDVETAEIYEGLTRQIQLESNADVAYDTAVDFQVTMGFGYMRVVTEYEADDSFNQVIRIKRVKNPFMVYLDPAASEPDGSDALYGFVADDVPLETFKRDYPKAKYNQDQTMVDIGNTAADWMNSDFVRVAEYFSIEESEETLLLLADGRTLWESEYKRFLERGDMVPQVMRARKADRRKVMWRKITACEVLEELEWAGKYIPIVPVYGEDIEVDGKRLLQGMVRGMKDSQRMYNYWSTAQTEAIALAPKSPFVIAEGQLEGYETFWKTANRANYAYLPYKPTTIEGIIVPAPQRQQAEPPVQAMVQAIQQASEDMKATTGIYDASLGTRSNETSGRAINARRAQGDAANFHYIDNLSRSIRQVGKIIVDLIPRIYDSARVVRILGEDDEGKLVKINQMFQDANGEPKLIDLTQGRFDVTVITGPSFATKRIENADFMTQMIQAYPPLMEIAGDLLVKNMDFPAAQQIAERMREKMGIKDDKDKKELPPEVMQQMQQAQQMIDALTEQLNVMQQEKEIKEAENASREKIAMMNNETKITIEAIKAENEANMQMLMAEIGALKDKYSSGIGIDTPDIVPPNGIDNYGGQPLA